MRSRPYLFVVIAFALFVVLVYPLRDTLVDDTFIHLVYARNLADAGELSFNRGDPTYGATSPLWVGLLAILYAAGVDLTIGCRVLSWLFALCSIALVYRLARRSGCGPFASVSAALVMSAEAWFLRWSAVGMETSFALFMVLLVLDRAFSTEVRDSILFGLLVFLAMLARPEALLLAPLALLAVFFTRRRGVMLWLAVLVLLLAGWFIVIERHTGTYFPLTAGAKQGRPVLSAALIGRAAVPVKIIGATLALPVLALITGLVAGARRGSILGCIARGRHSYYPVLLMILWAVVLPTLYVILDFQVLSRYLLPVSPAIIVLAFSSISGISERVRMGPGARRALIAIFTAVTITQNVLFYAIVVVPPTRAFSRGLTEVIGSMGSWLAANSAPEAVVAAPDIGAVGYYSRRRILDLGGLVTPEINEMRQHTDVELIVEEGLYLRFGPDYLLDRSRTPMRFEGRVIDGIGFQPIMDGLVENLGIRQPEPVHYVLYRLDRMDR